MSETLDEPADAPPRVFISYAHESPAHSEAVRALWVLLRTQGVDAQLDVTATAERQDWPAWMTQQVRSGTFVLVVASPEYRRRADGEAAPSEGRGVQFEARLIRDAFYADQVAGTRRILPVLLDGASTDDIPAFLLPASGTHYPVADLTPAGVEELLRVLLGQPLDVAPPIGERPSLPPRPLPAAVALVHELVLKVTLEDGALRCRTLLGGAVLGERAAPLPAGLGGVWDNLQAPRATDRLADVGRALRGALLDDDTVSHIVGLVDKSPLGTVVDVVVEAEGDALGLPFELLRLPDQRLVATLPGVRIRRRLRGLGREATPSLPGPLKLLVAVGAPYETRTNNEPLDVEAEMQAILDALPGLGAGGGAEVTILEVASPQEIASALASDQYHVLHLSAHGSPSSIELEDEDGDRVEVRTADLVRVLRSGGRPLPLVVLSTCAGAAGGSESLAVKLIEGGVDRVVAMQASVTDTYATGFAREHYEVLAVRGTVAAAVAAARTKLEDDRLASGRTSGRSPAGLPEYAVATLLSAAGDPALVDGAAALASLARPLTAPSGGTVRRLRIGDLIGRREELREAMAALRGGQQALERFGAIAGVVLTGVGGIGKTALAGRIETRLADDGWLVAVHVGRWNPSALRQAVAGALDGHDDALSQQASALLQNPEIDDTQSFHVIAKLLRHARLLLIFDDFEQNLILRANEIAFDDPGFEESFAALCEGADRGRLLVTSRYPVPGAEQLLHRIQLRPLSAAERRRMLLRLPALRELQAADRAMLATAIGGHPRLLELADALLRGGKANLREVTRKLRDLAGSDIPLVPGGPGDTAALREAVMVLGARDIMLDKLWLLLTDEQRELLLQAAVSREPQSLADLALARWGSEATEALRRAVRVDAERLLDLTLLSVAGDKQIIVHPWIVEALGARQDADPGARHLRAAHMRVARVNAGTGGFGDLVEVCRHFAAAGLQDELVQCALDGAKLLQLAGELSVAAFLAEVVPLVSTEHADFLVIAEREPQALANAGSVSAALTRAEHLLGVARARAEADPSNAPAQRALSVVLNQLGDLLVRLGDGAQAERRYRDGLTIRERLAAADPGNAQAQRDLSISYEKLGDLLLRLGDGPQAERRYRDGLTISERLAAADRGNAQAQRDLSVSYERLGDLLLRLGDGPQAERHYRADLEIAERLAAADPGNAQAQRDLSISYEKLGDLLLRLGDGAQAERRYRDGLTIRERLAAADPGNAQAQRDLSVSYEKLGDLLLRLGDGPQAERRYRDSLTIRERLAAADPGNAQAQRDLSVSYERLGDLLLRLGDGPQAERHYRADLEIAERLAAADPGNAQAQRDLSVSYEKLGDLLLRLGDGAQAERRYRDSLTIRERLAAADPGNAQAQRDLSVSYEKLGDLLLRLGDGAQAERRYRDSLTIRERLAAADPGNAQAQRDLSISYNKLGDLLLRLGDGAQAERRYRDSLTIRERLAAADPGNAQAQRDLSISYEKLGDLLLRLGDGAQAERRYRDSLTIRERLAAADPGNAQAQRDLSISYNKLGDLLLRLGDGPQAERRYRDSLTIRERLAAADPGNAQAQRDLSISYEKLGDLLLRLGDGAQAERHYRDSLTIRERLATADPGNAQGQQDLVVSHGKLGDLLARTGDHEQARRHRGDALAIVERLFAPDHPLARELRDKLDPPDGDGAEPATPPEPEPPS